MFNKQYTDQQIIEGCCANSRQFQEMLYKKYFRSLYFYCQRFTQNEEYILEIINNSFLKIFQKIQSFSGIGSFEGWMKVIVRHAVADYFKNLKDKETLSLEHSEEEFIHPEILSKLYENDLLTLLNHLPQSTSRIFELYVLEGMTHEEISKSQNISIGTSKWHLSEAKKKLRWIIENLKNETYAY